MRSFLFLLPGAALFAGCAPPTPIQPGTYDMTFSDGTAEVWTVSFDGTPTINGTHLRSGDVNLSNVINLDDQGNFVQAFEYSNTDTEGDGCRSCKCPSDGLMIDLYAVSDNTITGFAEQVVYCKQQGGPSFTGVRRQE